ncbi:hypothetical protein BDV95DRAFT_606892 [Massariosphaeria phaeospora]|uniref:Uncharacterized protein n=1 Tax=Massariosphaeria phaeospora TaxID=100035 RepID=A0A7C8I9B5_9PLEO|nr:hypothetical protein BDV95DRAFT_606892 [Massariosphaeria phaeospora]
MHTKTTSCSPLPSTTWVSAEFKAYYDKYWENYQQAEEDDDYQEDYRYFYPQEILDHFDKEGYDNTPPIDQCDLIDDQVHEIFNASNWVSPLPTEGFLFEIRHALSLVSKVLAHDDTLDWFVALYFSQSKYNANIRKCHYPPTITENRRGIVRRELRNLAGKIKFTFLKENDIGDCSGTTYAWLSYLCQIYEEDYFRKTQTSLFNRDWYDSFDNNVQPTICFAIGLYHSVMARNVSESSRMRQQLRIAALLLHELAHACCFLWLKGDADWIEPIVGEHDTFPEVGISLERSVFGASVCGYGTEVLTSMPLELRYPLPNTELKCGVPLKFYVPMARVYQWFLKTSWEGVSTAVQQKLPPIHSDADIPALFELQRFMDGCWITMYYYQGQVSAFDDTGKPIMLEREFSSFDDGAPSTIAEIAKRYLPLWKADLQCAARGGHIGYWADKHVYWDLASIEKSEDAFEMTDIHNHVFDIQANSSRAKRQYGKRGRRKTKHHWRNPRAKPKLHLVAKGGDRRFSRISGKSKFLFRPKLRAWTLEELTLAK